MNPSYLLLPSPLKVMPMGENIPLFPLHAFMTWTVTTVPLPLPCYFIIISAFSFQVLQIRFQPFRPFRVFFFFFPGDYKLRFCTISLAPATSPLIRPYSSTHFEYNVSLITVFVTTVVSVLSSPICIIIAYFKSFRNETRTKCLQSYYERLFQIRI